MIHPQGRARATVRWTPRHRADRTVADLMVRFLLPLIYRNEVMTMRLTESILMGKSVVR